MNWFMVILLAIVFLLYWIARTLQHIGRELSLIRFRIPENTKAMIWRLDSCLVRYMPNLESHQDEWPVWHDQFNQNEFVTLRDEEFKDTN